MHDRVQRVHEQIDRDRLRRHSNRVLHGHPSPMLWDEPDVPVDEILKWRRHPRSGPRKDLLLYVGVPFCLPTAPDRCGFCLFPSEVYKGPEQLVTYLRYLRAEGGLYRGWFDDDEVRAVYVGGGTANLFAPGQYQELLDVVRAVCPLAPDVEVTVEGVAQLFTATKLERMREAGVTRVSLGVQQLDPELLALSGRKQSVAHVLRMIDRCQELGLACNVDLIYGWPRQTVDQMLQDLDTMARLRVPHLTHYELNVAGRTDFARRRRDELPSVEQNLEMYRVAWQFLHASGYRQVTSCDWERVEAGSAGAHGYETRSRAVFRREPDGRISGHDVWGWGFAGLTACYGYPRDPGWVFTNAPRVDDYYRQLDAGRFPAVRGFRYSEPDLRVYTLFRMLQELTVDRRLYAELFGVDPVEEHAPVWEALAERDWVVVEDDRLTVIGDGGFYTPLIQGLVAAERLEAMRRSRRAGQSASGAAVAAEVVS
jgi:oxygen-independent coproporphyrinogen-3 oxidase